MSRTTIFGLVGTHFSTTKSWLSLFLRRLCLLPVFFSISNLWPFLLVGVLNRIFFVVACSAIPRHCYVAALAYPLSIYLVDRYHDFKAGYLSSPCTGISCRVVCDAWSRRPTTCWHDNAQGN